MSNDLDKLKNSKRRYKDDVAIKKQIRIAKSHRVDTTYTEQPHRFAKHHVLNCGNPNCVLCSNPRKTFNELTFQEQKLFQDIDSTNDKHSNGLKPEE
jgi:hypothetical protein